MHPPTLVCRKEKAQSQLLPTNGSPQAMFPGAMSSLMRSPVAIGFPAPQTSARRNRMGGEQRPGDGGDHLGERLDAGGLHGERGVEQVGQADPMGLGHQARQGPVVAPRPTLFHELQAGLAASEEEEKSDPPPGVLVRDLDRLGPQPLDLDYSRLRPNGETADQAPGRSSSSRSIRFHPAKTEGPFL